MHKLRIYNPKIDCFFYSITMLICVVVASNLTTHLHDFDVAICDNIKQRQRITGSV